MATSGEGDEDAPEDSPPEAAGVAPREPRWPALGGRYELRRLIAIGGMGQVWEARDTALDRDVAVKVLRGEYAGDATFLARFRAEAHHLGGLVHPNIAALLDYDEQHHGADDDTSPGTGTHTGTGPDQAVPGLLVPGERLAYLVMELVRGESLATRLARVHRLGPAETLDLVGQAAAGLARAHRAGVVHRDVKPGNLLLGDDGCVKLTDFGVAWSAASVPLTQTGQVVGTAHYLAPEQAEGDRALPAGDVYALGMVAYRCLAGRTAFDGAHPVQIALKQVREAPPPLPAEVPDPIRRLVARMLAKDPAERIPDGAALQAAVEELRTSGPALSPAAPLPTALPARLPAPALPTSRLSRTLPGLAAVPGLAGAPGRSLRRVAIPLLALAAIGTAIVGAHELVLGPAPSAPATTAEDPSEAATDDPRLVLDPGTLLGRPLTEVQAGLSALGLQVEPVARPTTDVAEGTVLAIYPVGELTTGDVVTVTYAVAGG